MWVLLVTTMVTALPSEPSGGQARGLQTPAALSSDHQKQPTMALSGEGCAQGPRAKFWQVQSHAL